MGDGELFLALHPILLFHEQVYTLGATDSNSNGFAGWK